MLEAVLAPFAKHLIATGVPDFWFSGPFVWDSLGILPLLHDRVVIAWTRVGAPRIIRMNLQLLGVVECHVVRTHIGALFDTRHLPDFSCLLADWIVASPSVRRYPLHAITAAIQAEIEKGSVSLSSLEENTEAFNSPALRRVLARLHRYSRLARIKNRPRQERAPKTAPALLPALSNALLAVPCDRHGRPLRRLTGDEKTELLKRWQQEKDIKARNALMLADSKLAFAVAGRLVTNGHAEDLQQEAMTGLARAADLFDISRGLQFTTYAVPWIRAKTNRYWTNQYTEETAPPMGVLPSSPAALKNRTTIESLNKIVSIEEANGMEVPYLEIIEDRVSIPMTEVVHSTQAVETLVSALNDVLEDFDDPRLRIIAERRILADVPESYDELGKRLNLSKERVRILTNTLVAALKEAFTPVLP